MIDNKKIKDVAKLHAEKSYISDYFQACYKDGFIDCAKWMQEEFLKDLWYPASEEPKHNKQITYVWGNGIAKTIILNEEADKFNRTPSQIWHNICKNYKVAHWLYISDLLPKEGDGQ